MQIFTTGLENKYYFFQGAFKLYLQKLPKGVVYRRQQSSLGSLKEFEGAAGKFE